MEQVSVNREQITLLLGAMADVNRLAQELCQENQIADMPNPDRDYESLRDAICALGGSMGFDVLPKQGQVCSDAQACEGFIKILIAGLVEHHRVSYDRGRFSVGGIQE